MQVAVASDFTNLVYHALAFVRVDHHSSTWDPDYIAWAKANLLREANSWFETDQAAFATLYSRATGSEALHAMPLAYECIEDFLATANAPLRSLDSGNAMLDALKKLDESLVEVFRANLALAAPTYKTQFEQLIRPELEETIGTLNPLLSEANNIDSTIDQKSIELVAALGPRGRGLGKRIIVGGPVHWTEMLHATPVVLALHEIAVQRSSERRPGYFASELAALCDLAQRLTAGPPALRDAHRSWVASLNLDSFLVGAHRAGLIDDRQRALLADPQQRQALLVHLNSV